MGKRLASALSLYLYHSRSMRARARVCDSLSCADHQCRPAVSSRIEESIL